MKSPASELSTRPRANGKAEPARRTPKTPKAPRLTEATVAALCDQLATRTGWTVERYEQRRASMITEGLPDRRYVREGRRVWVELKAPDGKLTPAQDAWIASELAAGGMATAVDSPQALADVLRDCQRGDRVECYQHHMRIAARGFRHLAKTARRRNPSAMRMS